MFTIRPCACRSAGRQAWVTASWAIDVDLELVAQLVDRQELERAADRDAGVVDQPVEPLRGRARRSSSGFVTSSWTGCTVGPSASAAAGSRTAGEHGRAELGEHQRGRAADAGRGAGDQHGAAGERGHRGEPIECPACCSPSSPPPPRTFAPCPGAKPRSSGSRRRCARWRSRSGPRAPDTSRARRASGCWASAGRR